ncbi:MAG: hypothetical protein H6573_01980 [Lewinellaceae bacterium]|nr:hypothetical protein [Phaeodactylibacter sp.]MCB0613566.1 hypothetical protein [Phaeodactylibacter sp.]MCB9346266.1 hypothetical protein [Lewinellaceae bacterium]
MKILLSAILMLLFLGHVLYLPMAVLWLEGQREVIARERCLNRDKPELMCQGSCYINQAVADAVERGASDEMPPASSQEGPLFLSTFLPGSLSFPAPSFDFFSPQPYYRPLAYYCTLTTGVFRPPRLERQIYLASKT